jgi:hypothetical protein
MNEFQEPLEAACIQKYFILAMKAESRTVQIIAAV